MKKLLVVFNDVSYSASLGKFALDLAQATDSSIQAVFINPYIFSSRFYPFPSDLPLTTNEFSFATEEMETEQKLHDVNVKMFREACAEAGVSANVGSDVELTVEELISQSSFADVVLCEAQNRISELYVKELLADTHCPVLLVPENAPMPERIVCCYDESFSSMLAIKMFSYIFPEWRELPTVVLSINPKESGAESEAQLAGWTQVHFPVGEREVVEGNLERELVGSIHAGERPTVVVMGAFGRSAVSRMFHRSLANVVIEETKALLFIIHQ